MNKKTQNTETKKPENNIEQIDALVLEFNRGKLQKDPRKKTALLNRLRQLWNEGIISVTERKLILNMWRNERKSTKGRISRTDTYLLNEYEHGTLNDKNDGCIVKSDRAAHGLQIGSTCRFSYNPNDLYGKDQTPRFHVYYKKVISSKDQMTQEMAEKIKEGRPVKESEWAKPKTQIRRVSLNEREFKLWFDLQNDAEILSGVEEKVVENYDF